MKRMREFEIERQFNIKIEDMKPNKGVYFMKTNVGYRCLKKINYGVQKLYFVYGAKEHLINNGFVGIDRYYLNEEGGPYALVNEDIYTLSDWIDGRECDFRSDDDIKLSSETLARLHELSKGYDPPENSKLKTDLGRWTHLMEKRMKSFDKMRDMARKKSGKCEVDITYIKLMPYYRELAQKALEALNNSNYIDVCRKSEEEKIFCHHDYTNHNIIMNDIVNVIDFDYCKREVRAYDIANFIIKVLKRTGWDIEHARMIIDSYSAISQITDDELSIIYSFLLFPQRFWRLSNRYFYSEIIKIQNSYNDKLLQLDEEKELYTKFIAEFQIEYGQKP